MALKQTMTTTTLELIPIELFYEIFTYFQLHEVFNIFSNLNSRFAAIINNMPIIPVYLGSNGINIPVTEFYYAHLSQLNISCRLITLCVSDRLAIDNGIWLAEHVSTFINLRHLSLIDIKRSSFELTLNSLSPIKSLIMFSLRFSTDSRAAYTFSGAPESAYYDRIFHLFPSLRVCHLFFRRYIHSTLDGQFVLPFGRAFMPIQVKLLNLQSLALFCSPGFLEYLFEYLPQLEQLSYTQTAPWLPREHPLRYNSEITPINKRLAPNLRRLKIKWFNSIIQLKSINKLFERDVLFSLTNFRLYAKIAGPRVLHNLVSMLSNQCLYSFDVKWFVRIGMSVPNTDKILSDTCQNFKGSVSIELELSLKENVYSIRAATIPRMDKSLRVYSYLDKNTVYGRNQWSYNRCVFNSQLFRCNAIIMNEDYRINDKFLSLLPPVVLWHQVTSLSIPHPFNSTHLHLLFSQTTNLRILELHYRREFEYKVDSKRKTLIHLFNDTSLCNMLMSNGLRQLNLFPAFDQSNLIKIGNLIVKRLSSLQVIKLESVNVKLIEMSHILINGLEKLSFLTIIGADNYGEIYDQGLRDLQNSNTRSFRTEVPKTIDENTLFVWL
ncbi:unnamed protein product [Rotaria socialis]